MTEQDQQTTEMAQSTPRLALLRAIDGAKAQLSQWDGRDLSDHEMKVRAGHLMQLRRLEKDLEDQDHWMAALIPRRDPSPLVRSGRVPPPSDRQRLADRPDSKPLAKPAPGAELRSSTSIIVDLPEPELKLLKALAEEAGCPESWIAREMLTQAIRNHAAAQR